MFDLGWSKLIIIAMLAIVVVGPKELPALLRTIGKFVGQIRRQADEFRRQFDEAMRDTELEQIRKDVADIKRTATDSMRDLERSTEESLKPLETATAEMNQIGQAHVTGPTTPVLPTAAPQIATELPPPSLPSVPVEPPTSAPPLTKTGA